MLNNLEWLLQMIQENPELEVIPIVSDEVIDKEYKLVANNRYMGNIGTAEVQMYLKGESGIRLYSDCSYYDTLIEFGGYTEQQCKGLSDNDLEEAYNILPWKKAIFLNIDWVEE